MLRRRGWLRPVLLLALTACGGASGEPAGLRVAVDTVADTVVVRTLAGSVWGGGAELVEEVRIGVMEGAEPYVLGDPRALAAAPDGGVYVLDVHGPVVRRYDAAGVHLGDLGREGGGPGEYRRPDGVAVLPDGRVLVRDPGTARINLYGPDGEPLTSWPHPAQGRLHTYQRFYVDTAGRSYVTTLVDWSVPPWDWELALVPLSPDGVPGPWVRRPPLAYHRAILTASGPDGRGQSRRDVPFTSRSVWDFSPLGYMVAGVTGRYAVYLFPPGRPVIRIERDSEPVPVRPEEAEEQRAAIERDLQRQYPGWRWNGPDVPAEKPPFRDLVVDSRGRVWVLRSTPGEAAMSAAEARAEEARTGRAPLRYREPPLFDVFEPDGRYLGPVLAPPSLRTEPRPVIVGDTVWAVTADELGVPAVVRYRVRRLP